MGNIFVVGRDDAVISDINRIYLDSFPVEERRNWDELLQHIDNGRAVMLAMERQQEVVAFAVLRNVTDFVYVEYLAVSFKNQGMGYGSSMLEHITASYGNVVLEVELPHTSIQKRRIAFYEQRGFTLLQETYFQPPYGHKIHLHAGDVVTDIFNASGGIPLNLMVCGQHPVFSQVAVLAEFIYRNIYDVVYDK